MQTINLKTNKGNSINEVILIKPDIFSDKRGFFYESWNLNSFKKIIGKTNFCQDNHSNSIKSLFDNAYEINMDNLVYDFISHDQYHSRIKYAARDAWSIESNTKSQKRGDMTRKQ